MSEQGWTPRKSLDVESRRHKASKIVRLLQTAAELRGASVLEIGCGAGVLATMLAEQTGPDGDVWGVDVTDLRVVSDAFRFKLVSGTTLPFDDASFDVVVSNHVIEHVGSQADQLVHLREIARVLRPGGIAYLAAPQRWALIEPHFKLPLLSWIPERWRTPYVRAAKRGTIYDCNLPARGPLRAMVRGAGLRMRDLTLDAVRALGEIERPSGPVGWVARAPDPVLEALRPLIPTTVLLLQKP